MNQDQPQETREEAELELEQLTDLVIRRALVEVEPPEGMWRRFQPRFEAEPLEAPGVLAWIRELLDRVIPDYRMRTALAGACVFLLAYRSLWWDGGGGFLPVTRSNMRWAILEDSFDRASSDLRWDLLDESFEQVGSDLRWNLLDRTFDEYEQSLEGKQDEPNN